MPDTKTAGRTLTFDYERETKRTYVYSEAVGDHGTIVGTLYVQKWAYPDGPPRTLTVTISG